MQLHEIYNWINSTSKAADSDFIRRALLLVAINHVATLPHAIRQAEQIRKNSKSLLPINKKSSESLVNQITIDELPKPLSGLPTQLFERLGNIATINKGLTPIQKAIPGQYPLVVTAKDRLTSSTYDFDTPAAIIPTVSSTGHGDASLKRIHYQEGKYAVGSILAVVQPKKPELISARFIYEYLSVFKDELLVSRMVGTANVSLTISKIMEVPIPLVSGSIIDGLPELMALCDQLEQQHSNAQDAHKTLVSQLLATLTQSQNAAEFNTNWQRIYAHFDVLFTTEASIDALKQTLLQLAVMGKLVPQDPNDEHVSVTLDRLKEKERNTKVRRGVQNEVVKPDLLNEVDLPESWVVTSTARLIQLGAILDLKDGNHGANHPKVSEFTETGVPFITAAQVSENGVIDYAGAYKLSGQALKRIRVGFAKAGDVIYTHKGSVGRVGICNCDCILTPQTTYYRLYDEVLCAEYVSIYLRSPQFRNQVDVVKRQTTRDFVSINAQYQFFFYVPPLAEQHRIVAKIDALMALCDQLKARIQQANQQQRAIADALVAQAVA